MTTYTFRAHVAPEAIDKVGRLFNASLNDILNELFQNARRAGATRIAVDQTDDPQLGLAIRVADDGPGLDDPQSLFSLGRGVGAKTASPPRMRPEWASSRSPAAAPPFWRGARGPMRHGRLRPARMPLPARRRSPSAAALRAGAVCR